MQRSYEKRTRKTLVKLTPGEKLELLRLKDYCNTGTVQRKGIVYRVCQGLWPS